MASIEKIYGTREQYLQLKDWINDNRPELLRFLYPIEPAAGAADAVIANFPVRVDQWLLDNCNIDFVIDRIKDQYHIK